MRKQFWDFTNEETFKKNTPNSNAAITKANLDGIKEISQNQIHLRASESSSVADAGPGGEALNMAVFPDKHCRAWGGFRQTGELEAVCRGLRGEADWINSSLRLLLSKRSPRKYGRKMERLYPTLTGLLNVCILDCSMNTAHICSATEMIRSILLIRSI